jgi:hypothetical protein
MFGKRLKSNAALWYKQLNPTEKQDYRILRNLFFEEFCRVHKDKSHLPRHGCERVGDHPGRFLWRFNVAAKEAKIGAGLNAIRRRLRNTLSNSFGGK